MRVAIFDRVEPPMPTTLPIRLDQDCAQRSTAFYLFLVVPAAAIVITAAASVLAQALTLPGARALLQQRPALAFEIFAAAGFLLFLLTVPARRLLARLTATRTVDIADGHVTVTDATCFNRWTWSAPLASYLGVAHHVRASLSASRHELILVHPEREKSILLCVAPKTTQGEVDRVASLLGQRQVPPSELYRFKGLWPRMVTQPLPEASHA